MSSSLLRTARNWHKKIASVLFVFFFIIALTGLLLGWKKFLSGASDRLHSRHLHTDHAAWLSLDSLQSRALGYLRDQHIPVKTGNVKRVDFAYAKGYLNFSFNNNYSVAVDGYDGSLLLLEYRKSSLIQDIHDGSILDNLFHLKGGPMKEAYSTIMGVSLLLLTISGFWLWYKPKQIRKARR